MKKLNNILLVDDDAISNFVSQNILMSLGITEKITVKTNGKSGLDFVRESCSGSNPACPQIIIFDFNMPVMDGLEFLKALNELELQKKFQTVLLLLAVQIPQDMLIEFLNLGIQEYTLKPLDEPTIMSTYQKYWDKEGIWIG